MRNPLRRNPLTPVQVRRADEVRQGVVDIPSARAGGAEVAGIPPNVTQNNIYISAPAATQSPSAPAPPQEIHHHTTVHHVSRVILPSRGLSFFGVAGLVLGGVGCAAAYEPAASMFVRPLAVAGLFASGLGLLGAILFARSGRGIPLLGLMVSAAAWGLWFQANGGHLQAEMQKMREKLPAQIPSIDLGKVEQKLTPVVVPAEPTVAPAVSVPTVVAPTPVDLETAREAAAERMGLDYKSAKAAAVKARSDVDALQPNAGPQSPELVAARQKAADADLALNTIERKLRSDPAVAAAEKAAGHGSP